MREKTELQLGTRTYRIKIEVFFHRKEKQEFVF
jgi:hypothetical protein